MLFKTLLISIEEMQKLKFTFSRSLSFDQLPINIEFLLYRSIIMNTCVTLFSDFKLSL